MLSESPDGWQSGSTLRGAFFNQQRVGLNGDAVTLRKFRTMVDGVDRGGARFALADDDRLTSVGRSATVPADELPQLWNVLVGDLSLVGTRPKSRSSGQRSPSRFLSRHRHLIRPGVTGWAQVNYGYADDEADTIEKLTNDLDHLKHISLRVGPAGVRQEHLDRIGRIRSPNDLLLRVGFSVAARCGSRMSRSFAAWTRLPAGLRRSVRALPGGVSRVRTVGSPKLPAVAEGERRAVVYLPTWTQWDVMRQRPQYLLAAFAQAGYPVYFIDPWAPKPVERDGVHVVTSIRRVPAGGVILYVHFAPLRHMFGRFDDAVVVYDLLDDLTIYDAEEEGLPLRGECRLTTHR